MRIVGACTLLKMGYDNLGVGRYYSFYLLKQIPKIKNEIDKKKRIEGRHKKRTKWT